MISLFNRNFAIDSEFMTGISQTGFTKVKSISRASVIAEVGLVIVRKLFQTVQFCFCLSRLEVFFQSTLPDRHYVLCFIVSSLCSNLP